MRNSFPLFSNPIDLAHIIWKLHLPSNPLIIDATVGNGQDTLFLADLANNLNGQLIGIDIQKQAIDSTQSKLIEHPSLLRRVQLFHQSHATFPSMINPESVDLIVYNLGYLPGADKSITTLSSSTIESVRNGLNLIKAGGIISITCYPGHEEGFHEYNALIAYTQTFDKKIYGITKHEWVNRKSSPILLLIQKNTPLQARSATVI